MSKQAFEIQKETIENVSWWNGIMGASALGTFFATMKYLAKTRWEKLVLGLVGLSEAVQVAKATYDLFQIQLAENNNPDATKAYKKKVNAARGELAFAVTKAALIGTAIVGGTFLGVAAIGAVAPILFLTVSAISCAKNLGTAAIHLYKGKPRKAAESLAYAAVDAVIGAAIVLAIMTAPISVPAMALAAGATLGGLVLYKIGCAVYDRCSGKKPETETVNTKKPGEFLDNEIHTDLEEDKKETNVNELINNSEKTVDVNEETALLPKSNKAPSPSWKTTKYFSNVSISKYFCIFSNANSPSKPSSMEKTEVTTSPFSNHKS